MIILHKQNLFSLIAMHVNIAILFLAILFIIFCVFIRLQLNKYTIDNDNDIDSLNRFKNKIYYVIASLIFFVVLQLRWIYFYNDLLNSAEDILWNVAIVAPYSIIGYIFYRRYIYKIRLNIKKYNKK